MVRRGLGPVIGGSEPDKTLTQTLNWQMHSLKILQREQPGRLSETIISDNGASGFEQCKNSEGSVSSILAPNAITLKAKRQFTRPGKGDKCRDLLEASRVADLPYTCHSLYLDSTQGEVAIVSCAMDPLLFQ